MQTVNDPKMDWISYVEAGRILGVSNTTVRKMVNQRALTSQRLPGCHPRVLRCEVLKLAEECVEPRVPVSGR